MLFELQQDDDEVHLSSALVRRRYCVTDMTIWRWLHDPDLGFPQPIRIGTRRYWRLTELKEFEQRCARKQSESTAA